MIGAKAATGIGAFLSGLGLQLVGFTAPAEGSAATIPADTATAVGLLWGLGGALVVLAAIPFLYRYRIDRARHAEILASLAARPSAMPSPVPNTAPLAQN